MKDHSMTANQMDDFYRMWRRGVTSRAEVLQMLGMWEKASNEQVRLALEKFREDMIYVHDNPNTDNSESAYFFLDHVMEHFDE